MDLQYNCQKYLKDETDATFFDWVVEKAIVELKKEDKYNTRIANKEKRRIMELANFDNQTAILIQ